MELPEIPTSLTVLILLLLIVLGIVVAEIKSQPIPEFLIVAFTSIVGYLLGYTGKQNKGGGNNGNV